MKVELHLHTSRYSGCATATPAELMRKLIETGYGAVYITEHDAIWPEKEIDQLQEAFPAIGVFPGVELSVGDDLVPLQHLLVLGTSDASYLWMRHAADILHKARAEGHLTVLAHPARWLGGAEMLEEGLLPDAMEYYTCNQEPYRADQARIRAERLALPLVNAGDTHGLSFVDRFWIETHRPIVEADDIRAIVLERAYENFAREKQ